jgi:hypothetical protein
MNQQQKLGPNVYSWRYGNETWTQKYPNYYYRYGRYARYRYR